MGRPFTYRHPASSACFKSTVFPLPGYLGTAKRLAPPVTVVRAYNHGHWRSGCGALIFGGYRYPIDFQCLLFPAMLMPLLCKSSPQRYNNFLKSNHRSRTFFQQSSSSTNSVTSFLLLFSIGSKSAIRFVSRKGMARNMSVVAAKRLQKF